MAIENGIIRGEQSGVSGTDFFGQVFNALETQIDDCIGGRVRYQMPVDIRNLVEEHSSLKD